MRYITFDIFDTCLVRTCGSPDGVFEIMAKSILTSGNYADIADFVKIRKDGEFKARRIVKEQEISIYDIYAQCDFSVFTKISKEKILEKELEIEEKVLLPVYTIQEKIKKYRNKGVKICFISDMYLPEAFIRKVLVKFDLLKEEDGLYLSSSYLATKSKGKLFQYFKDENPNANYFTWRHYGDNLRSDYLQAFRNGAFPVLVKHEFNDREKWEIKPYDPFLSRELQKYLSVCKAIRLSENENWRKSFAIDVIAPMYFSFVLHILENAKERGIVNLFFFARDGYIFYLIAKQLEEFYPKIVFHYLYI